jgi:hypothetical protein
VIAPIQISQMIDQPAATANITLSANLPPAGSTSATDTTTQTESTGIADAATALQSQQSGAQDVDMASTLSQLTQTQTQ